MTPADQPLERKLLTRDEVRKVLERAARNDLARDDLTTIDQLTTAAREAGISDEALMSAVRELVEPSSVAARAASADLPELPGSKPRFRLGGWQRSAVLASASSILGVLMSFADRGLEAANPGLGGLSYIVALLILVGGPVAFARDRNNRLRDVLMQTVALWGGFIVGAGLAYADPLAGLVCLFAAGVTGTLVTARHYLKALVGGQAGSKGEDATVA